jgi:hypothetical protein
MADGDVPRIEAADRVSAEPVTPPVCGIVMPISGAEPDYSAEHWLRVKRIIERSISRAGFTAQLVWENASIEIIQAKILKNIYENDVIICDVSALNSNVMLELGLRLSTKRPTIIITDGEVDPPFDVNVVGYLAYPKSLEFNAIDAFIDELAQRIKSVHDSYLANQYVSFVSSFRFETVSPQVTELTENEFLRRQVSALAETAARLDKVASRHDRAASASTAQRQFDVLATLTDKALRNIVDAAKRSKLIVLQDFNILKSGFGGNEMILTFVAIAGNSMAEARLAAQELIELEDDVPF